MKIVDPKSCGCARPDQHCEVPVPEAKYVGFTCQVGQFCCRMKKKPGPIDIKTIPKNIAAVDPESEKLPSPKPIRITPRPQQTQFKQTRNDVPRRRIDNVDIAPQVPPQPQLQPQPQPQPQPQHNKKVG